MLTRLYIEALLVDEELADQVWEAWNAGLINNVCAWIAWRLVANHTGEIVANTMDRANANSPP